ncbi:MAG: response regulator transcription factor [Eubacteriales bacterium]|nr:response regulator transcription factor [Eubacteriales bacterium]
MIYCVEDDVSIRELELYALRGAGFEAEGFDEGAAFLAALDAARPELVILDVMLPGEDGVTLLKRLKASPDTREVPVIMATAKGAEFDKVISLDLGADDYLVKPFGMLEMVSRVRAVLRRTAPKTSQLSAGTVCMDLGRHTVTVDGQPVNLTLKEYELLRVMMAHPGMVFTRDQLLEDVWNADFAGETRTVDVHVQTLRQKLGEAGGILQTVRGVGYRIGENQP